MTNLLKETDITIYRGIKDTKGFSSTLFYALNMIASGAYKDIIEVIRATSDKEKRSVLKLNLYAATFAGVFSKRGQQYCTSSSGIACLDFDDLTQLEKTKHELAQSKYCLSVFVSPSGKGLKMLIRIPLVANDERYKEYYKAALKYYSAFNPDTCTKDISRLCFLSHDPDIYINENAAIFTKKIISYVPKPKVRNFKRLGKPSEGATMKGLFYWWEKKHWDNSKRNSSLFKLAAAFCEYGVSHDSAWSVIGTYEEADLTNSELKKLTDSAYKRVSFNSKSFV